MKQRHVIIHNNKKGFTLIEVVVTLAILAIVISAISGMFTYNLRVFEKENKLSQVQFDVRMASDFIIKEIRNTQNISLSDDTFANKIDLNDLQLNFPSVKNVQYEIKLYGSNYLLSLNISGSDSNSDNTYSINSQVVLNNIKSAFIGTNNIIYYD